MNSFYRSGDDRRECCHIRKVLPLGRALAGARAWVTGMRREQSSTLGELRVVEVDAGNGGLVKFNPLAQWTEAEVWAFVTEHKVPTHSLHERGYRSIGCAPCTRAVGRGEDVRAGRWWWEDPSHKECGLHARRASSTGEHVFGGDGAGHPRRRGSGDPELLTLRGARALEEADLVLYDALVDPRTLQLASRAQRFFVGKRAGRASIAQTTICALLVRAARRGRVVVRLKAGDPFVLGRGGEEVLACDAAGVPSR